MGKKGWMDTANGTTRTQYYVILETEIGNISTRVAKDSVVEDRDAQTYVEAIFLQHPDILQQMNRLCRALATCKVDVKNQDELQVICGQRLQHAVGRNSGRRARFRHVDWNLDTDEEGWFIYTIFVKIVTCTPYSAVTCDLKLFLALSDSSIRTNHLPHQYLPNLL
jgi:hypothetical protein